MAESRQASAAVCAVVGLFAVTASATPAAAQNFFSSLFGGSSTPTAYAPQQNQPTGSIFGDLFGGPRQEAPRASGYAGGSQAYCVRLCDGRYFPLPRSSNASVSPAKICSAMCPQADSQVFNGSDPTQSVASDGTRYASLRNALLYRDKVVPGCSCTGNGPGGLAQIDVNTDPTLRAGDIVAQASGPAVFNGSSQLPHRTADFTPVNSRTPGSNVLANLRVDDTARSATPLQSLAPGADDRSAQPRRRARAPVTRQAAERSFFGMRFR